MYVAVIHPYNHRARLHVAVYVCTYVLVVWFGWNLFWWSTFPAVALLRFVFCAPQNIFEDDKSFLLHT